MALGSWNPEDGSTTVAYQVDAGILTRCAAFAASDNWSALPEWVARELPADASQLMKLDASQWHDALAQLDEPALLGLIRFFTLAEHQLPHWHGGDKSPVIWITRHLKKHGKPLSREMVLWIKANSDNRFLPNGPVL